MDNKNIGSLLSLPFFEGFNSDHVNNLIIFCKEINENTKEYDNLCYHTYDNFIFYKENIDNNNLDNFKTALNIELVEYSINTGLINFLFSSEEVDRIIFLVEKKQFNSNKIKSLINKILYLSKDTPSIGKKLADLFQVSINKRLVEIRKEMVHQQFLPLKKIIDNLTSGVNVKCYLNTKSQYYSNKILPVELNNYILEKYNYDFNDSSNNHLFYDYYSIIFEKLSLALLDDKNFWTKVDDKTFIYGFLNLVIKYNSLTHAIKIMDYIMDNLLKDGVNEFIIKNNYPLFINSKELENRAIDRCLDYTFDRFLNSNANDISKEEKDNLLYPLRDHNAKIGINKGKEIFETFVKSIYKEDYAIVLNIFKDSKTIIQDGDNKRKRELSLEIVLESDMFGYHDVGKMEQLYNIEKKYYYECYDFGNNENILSRFYYRVYLLEKYYKENSAAAIYEVFYECFSMIDTKYNTRCLYVHDFKIRGENYLKLKEILKKYDLCLNDDYKNNYIIALLDRKTATSDEESMFSELEEFGDAIYELGIINILFYQDEYKDIDYSELHKLVSAEEQIKVSKILGIDELYISSFTHNKNLKSVDKELLKNNKFLADSLEMIIGAIAKEFGIQKALDFVMQIVLKANKKYKMPNIKEYNEDDILFSNIILGDYEKFYPSYLNKYSNYNGFYYSFGEALGKILKIIVLGNETSEKRYKNKLINLFGEMQDANHKLICYFLRYGIEKTIEKYRSFILKNIKDL